MTKPSASSVRRTLAFVLAGALTSAGLVLVAEAPAQAAALNGCATRDNGDPVLDDMQFSTVAVDVTSASKTVTVTLAVHDTGGPGAASGIASANLSMELPGANRALYAVFHQDGPSWVGTMAVPRWLTPGVWEASFLSITDKAGNYAQYTNLDQPLPYRPFPVGVDQLLTVTSVADTTPPALQSLVFTPKAVDTRTKAKTITISGSATDAESGVNSISIYASRDSHVANVVLKHVTGNVFSGKLTIPKWVGTGVWKVQANVYDNIGNGHYYTYDQLGAAGIKRGFNVTSGSDPGDPRLVSFHKSKRKVDVRSHAGSLGLVVQAQDSVSGVAAVSVSFIAPDGVHGASANLKRVSGTAKNGIWKGAAKFLPCGSTPGKWKIWVYVDDAAGNSISVARRTVTILSKDHTTPKVTIATPTPGVNGPVTLSFNEAVNGITSSSIEIRHGFTNELIPGSWACKNGAGGATNCVTGSVRSASFTPAAPMLGGVLYIAYVNPEHNLGVTDLAGNPFRRSFVYFTATV